MYREIVGSVTESEKSQVLLLFERKNGLEELVSSLENPILGDSGKSDLDKRIIDDIRETETKLKAWWDRMYQKYKWKSEEGSHWSIDFFTNDIVLQASVGCHQ